MLLTVSHRFPTGGIHVEICGEDVTECTGGPRTLRGEDLNDRYRTFCDLRLNATQALSFPVAEEIKKEMAARPPIEDDEVEAAEYIHPSPFLWGAVQQCHRNL